MKKLLKLLFFMIIPVNGLSGMFSSEDNGSLPQEGFRFQHRSVGYNKDLQLVVPKACRDQKLYDWVPTGKYDNKGQEIWEKREVIKKEVDPSLLDDEGNLIVAQWFASKKLSFTEPEFKKETRCEYEWRSSSPYAISCMTFRTTETIQHAYDDEYSKYRSDEARAKNKKEIHSYINTAQSQQGIWTYLRGMKIVEYFFGKSQNKIDHLVQKNAFYNASLSQQHGREHSELETSLRSIEDELQKDSPNSILQKQKKLIENEIKSFKNEKNYLSFVRSSMKRSEFNKYVQFHEIIEKE